MISEKNKTTIVCNAKCRIHMVLDSVYSTANHTCSGLFIASCVVFSSYQNSMINSKLKLTRRHFEQLSVCHEKQREMHHQYDNKLTQSANSHTDKFAPLVYTIPHRPPLESNDESDPLKQMFTLHTLPHFHFIHLQG